MEIGIARRHVEVGAIVENTQPGPQLPFVLTSCEHQ